MVGSSMGGLLAALVGLLAVTSALAQYPNPPTPCTDATSVLCASGVCCTSAILATCPADPNGLCAGCLNDLDCGAAIDNQYCKIDASPVPVCTEADRTIGQSCTSSRQCTGQLFCSVGGVCAPPSTVGASCSLDLAGTTFTCGANAYCSAVAPATTGTCVIAGSYGANCNGVTPCLDSLQCDPNDNKCKYLYGPNQPQPSPPNFCNSDENCSDGTYCATNAVGPGTCQAAVISGPCLRDANCLSLQCVNSVCTVAPPCGPGGSCPAGQYCGTDSVCIPKFTNGSVCGVVPFANSANPAVCQSGICKVPTTPPLGPDTAQPYCMGCDVNVPNTCGKFNTCKSKGINICLPMGWAGQPCDTNSDCISNNCVAGVCVNGCRTTADCTGTYGPNYFCDPIDNLCKAPVLPGQACLTNSECGLNGICYQFVCRTACNYPFAAFCPLGTTCQPISPPGKSACLPGTPSPLRPDGFHCSTPGECASDICNCGICGWKCSCDADCSGQPGTRCNLNTGKCEGPPGLLPTGFACIFSEQCESGYCNCGFCHAYCRSNYDCALGYYCDSISAQCLWNRKPNGIRCITNEECQSGYCFDCNFCAPGCSPRNPCPWGQYCNAASQCVQYTPLPCPGCVNPYQPIRPLVNGGNVQPIIPLGNTQTLLPSGLPSDIGNALTVYGTVSDNGKCIRNGDCKAGRCQLRTGYGLCGDCRVWPGLCLAGSTCNTLNGLCIANVIAPGLVPDGGLCAADTQCQSGVCNYQTCGKCNSSTKQCLLGTTCDSNGKCVPLLPTPSANCPDGFSCTTDTQCASGVCNLGICGWCFPAKYGFPGSCPSGFTCGSNGKCAFIKLNDGSPCINGTQCASGICTGFKINGVLQSICQAKCLINADCAPGYACNPSSGKCVWWLKPFGSVCRADWECRSNFCDPDFNVCTAKCTETALLFSSCPLGTSCNTTSHICEYQQKNDGAVCTYDNECWAGVCNNGYCGSCSSPVYSGCPTGQTCGSNGRCTKSLKKDGQFCIIGADCLSGFCIAGQCGLPCGADPSRSCPNGYYCKQGSCLPGCYYDGDCAAGSLCYKSVCRPRVGAWDGEWCTVDSECLSTWCYAGVCKSKGQWMERCGADIECQSGYCDTSFTVFGWGVCTLPCSGPNAGCPGGYYCASGPRWYSSMCVQQAPGFRPGFAVPYDANNALAAQEALKASALDG